MVRRGELLTTQRSNRRSGCTERRELELDGVEMRARLLSLESGRENGDPPAKLEPFPKHVCTICTNSFTISHK